MPLRYSIRTIVLCVSGILTYGNVGVLVMALPACDSEIWCDGPLLEAVQNARIYEDSKTFVDMNLKYKPDIVLPAFKNLSSAGTPKKAQLREFLQMYFEGPDTEFEKWIPTDFNKSPAFLAKVKDENLQKFGKAMCEKWKHLGRKIRQDVKDNQDRYSLIYLDHPFIVPGGRFRETYYWDSYWVIRGLLVCGMEDTAKGMLENFISLVQRYGMVPNGNRLYYTRRSQPPFLIPMVELYIKATNDVNFLRKNILYLAEEYKFWMRNRSVLYIDDGLGRTTLNRFSAPITLPRPESFKEDISTQKMSKVSASKMYQNLASAAESGWDFSSRWFSEDFQDNTSDHTKWLKYTDTTDVVPVDLNSILCWNEMLMAKFYDLIGERKASLYYKQLHESRQDTMMKLFWDQQRGVWFDLSLKTKRRRDRFFPSNVFPLFAGCYSGNKTRIEEQVLNYLQRRKVLSYQSGVPTSLLSTGQQWDFPNAWPPLQHILVIALTSGHLEKSRKAGFKLASNWVQSNYIGWRKTGSMFEKYVVTAMGSRGSGGEYNVQEGFGWTNGVILDFLERFGQNLTLDIDSSNKGTSLSSGYVGTDRKSVV